MSYKDRLAKMQAQAKTNMEGYTPGGFSALPDGDYTMRVKATLEETKKAPPRLTIVWCFVVDEGECAGRQTWDRTIIEDNRVGLQIARGRVEELGYEWPEDDLSTLEDIVDDITDRAPHVTCRLRTKENGEYTNTNVRIREVHDLPNDVPESEEKPETDAADETPEPVEDEAQADTEAAALLDFCASQGIEGVTTDMSKEDIVAGLLEAKMTFEHGTLTQQEVVLLARCGLDSLIIADKPKAAPKLAAKAAPKAAPKLAAKKDDEVPAYKHKPGSLAKARGK